MNRLQMLRISYDITELTGHDINLGPASSW